MPVTKKETPIGTIRIKAKDLEVCIKTKSGWKKTNEKFNELLEAVKMFKAENNFKFLIDKKDPIFLKGQLSPEGLPQGARINILPTGEVLEKAFSLFSPHLKIHDETSHDHWDVIYQNKGGTYSYVYTLEKREKHRNRKYRKVEEFDKVYNKLITNIEKNLSNKDDTMAIVMHTLISTHMRIGNETYYKTHGHKGLATLTKDNIKIKNKTVIFDYIGKDGVPITLLEDFSDEYIKRLKSIIRKNRTYVFSKEDKALHENDFKRAFKNYCGKEFYPHIVRSHYATTQVKNFLKSKKKAKKEEIDELFLSIAHHLGHKKFDKKNQVWKDNYTVTISSYVQPELVKKIQKSIIK